MNYQFQLNDHCCYMSNKKSLNDQSRVCPILANKYARIKCPQHILNGSQCDMRRTVQTQRNFNVECINALGAAVGQG